MWKRVEEVRPASIDDRDRATMRWGEAGKGKEVGVLGPDRCEWMETNSDRGWALPKWPWSGLSVSAPGAFLHQ